MRIVILNGSPKGDESVTMQYVKYVEQSFPQHEFIYVNVAQSIRKLEKQAEEFDKVVETVKSSDGVIWAFPLYVFLVHAHYKRFIELIWERGAQEAFQDKYAALLATSIHFFDHTALNYMQAICDDLRMRYTDYFSAAMDDLLKEQERKSLRTFADSFFDTIANRRTTLKAYKPITHTRIEYIPSPVSAPLDRKGQSVVIVTDSADQEHNAGRMVERFRQLTHADVIDISKLDIKGGCTGCIKCGFKNECMYGDRDDIERTYGCISRYDIIVFAGTIRDRYLSARWKTFIDRRFFKTHQPHFTGRQIGYLVSGPLSQIPNLSQIFQATTQLDKANLVGILTDEYETSAEIDAGMEALAYQLIQCSLQRYVRPHTFLGLGGIKIFRDEIWGSLRFIFQGDHRYYKKNGVYDFPQKQYGTRVMNLFMSILTKIPPVRENIRKNLKSYMIRPYQKVLKHK